MIRARIWHMGLGLAAVAVLGLMVFFYAKTPFGAGGASGAATTTPQIQEYTPPPYDTAPAGSHTYISQAYGFSLQYPEELQVLERAEAAGGRTITFEDRAGEKGFQVFITPYKGAQIDQSRIALDTHLATKPQEVVLGGGLHALAFESTDPLEGHLREVWFLHKDYLYEVTTYFEFDSWLADVMKTLAFVPA